MPKSVIHTRTQPTPSFTRAPNQPRHSDAHPSNPVILSGTGRRFFSRVRSCERVGLCSEESLFLSARIDRSYSPGAGLFLAVTVPPKYNQRFFLT
jgi:hypothetical protein